MSRLSPASARPTILLCAVIAAAVLAPPLRISEHLPDLRVEQVLALPAGAWLTTSVLRAGTWRSAARTWLLPFAPLVAATIASIGYAGLVLGEPASPRDLFEVVKLGIYAVLFGFALAVCRRPRARTAALTAFLVAGLLAALIGLAQYIDLPGLVDATGGWWAPAQHLRALERDGRAFGTVGNPNYFGALMAMLAATGLGLWLYRQVGRRLPVVALAGGTLGVVLSGSRGALGMLIAAALVTLALALRRRAARRQVVASVATLTGLFLLAVLLVEVLPRGREDYLTRVAGAFSPTGDSGLALRLERWRALIGWERPAPAPAAGTSVAGTGLPAAPPEAAARDRRRKEDVRLLVAAVSRFRARTGGYPAVLGALVPAELPALPADPRSGAAYRYERTASGFTVTAQLEDPADLDYPMFATGDVRNLMRNGSAEEGDDGRAAEFRTIAGTDAIRAADAALYGEYGLRYTGAAAYTARRAAIYQQRFLNREGGAPFTATVWVRHDTPAEGEVFLYANVYYTDGSRQDPYARVAADPARTGIWQRLSLTIMPDAARRIDFLGVYLLSDRFRGQVSADGFELVEGRTPVSFIGLVEGEPGDVGLDAGARFRRSPVLGSGPGKAEGSATVDNEYLLVLARYGLAGMAAYLWLWGLTAWRAGRTCNGMAAALTGIVAGLLLFSVVAGSLYHMQLMNVFWTLAGVALTVSPPSQRAAAARLTPSTPGSGRASPTPRG